MKKLLTGFEAQKVQNQTMLIRRCNLPKQTELDDFITYDPHDKNKTMLAAYVTRNNVRTQASGNFLQKAPPLPIVNVAIRDEMVRVMKDVWPSADDPIFPDRVDPGIFHQVFNIGSGDETPTGFEYGAIKDSFYSGEATSTGKRSGIRSAFAHTCEEGKGIEGGAADPVPREDRLWGTICVLAAHDLDKEKLPLPNMLDVGIDSLVTPKNTSAGISNHTDVLDFMSREEAAPITKVQIEDLFQPLDAIIASMYNSLLTVYMSKGKSFYTNMMISLAQRICGRMGIILPQSIFTKREARDANADKSKIRIIFNPDSLSYFLAKLCHKAVHRNQFNNTFPGGLCQGFSFGGGGTNLIENYVAYKYGIPWLRVLANDEDVAKWDFYYTNYSKLLNGIFDCMNYDLSVTLPLKDKGRCYDLMRNQLRFLVCFAISEANFMDPLIELGSSPGTGHVFMQRMLASGDLRTSSAGGIKHANIIAREISRLMEIEFDTTGLLNFYLMGPKKSKKNFTKRRIAKFSRPDHRQDIATLDPPLLRANYGKTDILPNIIHPKYLQTFMSVLTMSDDELPMVPSIFMWVFEQLGPDWRKEHYLVNEKMVLKPSDGYRDFESVIDTSGVFAYTRFVKKGPVFLHFRFVRPDPIKDKYLLGMRPYFGNIAFPFRPFQELFLKLYRMSKDSPIHDDEARYYMYLVASALMRQTCLNPLAYFKLKEVCKAMLTNKLALTSFISKLENPNENKKSYKGLLSVLKNINRGKDDTQAIVTLRSLVQIPTYVDVHDIYAPSSRIDSRRSNRHDPVIDPLKAYPPGTLSIQ